MKKAPLVILHGWGLSAERFAPLAAEFERLGYKTYAPDLPGFGKSQIPKNPLTLSDYASFLLLVRSRILFKSKGNLLVGILSIF